MICAQIHRFLKNMNVPDQSEDARFEADVADLLARSGLEDIQREVPGEAASTIDFGFMLGGRPWRVELMRLNPSPTIGLADTTPMSNCRARLKISQKLFKGGRYRKFPQVDNGRLGTLHVMLVHIRSYHGDAADVLDIREILYGPGQIDPARRTIREEGLFEDTGAQRGSAARERLHYAGFVRAVDYTDGALTGPVRLYPNPALTAGQSLVLAPGDPFIIAQKTAG